MKSDLRSRVALKEDFPQYKLKRGDIATAVEHHPVSEGEDGYSLEVFNVIGDTIAVILVSAGRIDPLRNNEVLDIRVLDEIV